MINNNNNNIAIHIVSTDNNEITTEHSRTCNVVVNFEIFK